LNNATLRSAGKMFIVLFDLISQEKALPVLQERRILSNIVIKGRLPARLNRKKKSVCAKAMGFFQTSPFCAIR
jgi:hypothetical protein